MIGESVPLHAVHPTQLYLSSEKLAQVLDWFDPEAQTYDALPAFEYEGATYLADGHTRAFVAWLAGADAIRIEYDPTIRSEYDFDLYRTCIRWCADAGVETIPDLAGRLLGPEAYETRWIERCQRAGADDQ